MVEQQQESDLVVSLSPDQLKERLVLIQQRLDDGASVNPNCSTARGGEPEIPEKDQK